MYACDTYMEKIASVLKKLLCISFYGLCKNLTWPFFSLKNIPSFGNLNLDVQAAEKKLETEEGKKSQTVLQSYILQGYLFE